MVDYSRHFSFVILDEGQLRTIDLEEEIRFRFGINIESALVHSCPRLARPTDLLVARSSVSFQWETRRPAQIRSGRHRHQEVLCPA